MRREGHCLEQSFSTPLYFRITWDHLLKSLTQAHAPDTDLTGQRFALGVRGLPGDSDMKPGLRTSGL